MFQLQYLSHESITKYRKMFNFRSLSGIYWENSNKICDAKLFLVVVGVVNEAIFYFFFWFLFTVLYCTRIKHIAYTKQVNKWNVFVRADRRAVKLSYRQNVFVCLCLLQSIAGHVNFKLFSLTRCTMRLQSISSIFTAAFIGIPII